MRNVYDIKTGITSQVPETPEELAAAVIATAAEVAFNTPDNKASRSIDGEDRVIFDALFTHENRIRVLEGSAAITQAQFRTALINRWKVLNP